MAQPLPLVGATSSTVLQNEPERGISAAQAAELREALSDEYLRPLMDYLGLDNTPSDPEFQAFLQSRGLSNSSLHLTSTIQNDQILIQTQFVRTKLTQRSLDLGSNASRIGIRTNTANIPLNATITANLSFGLNLTKESIDDRFFFRLESFRLDLDGATPASMALDGKFVALQSTASNVRLLGRIDGVANDANGDGKLTLVNFAEEVLGSG